MEQLQYLELTATQLPNIVRMDDRLFMSASLESRIPFMDYQFVELACRIPPEYKIREGYTKYLMRCVFDARMPREVTWRTNKLGFGAPVDAWPDKSRWSIFSPLSEMPGPRRLSGRTRWRLWR
ncbi:MAG: asparagine synthase-related protein [Dysosmobacter welbionis]